jgi:hypothetical protein
MCTLSRDTFKRLVVLGTIAKFRDGVYGAKRLQKVVYLGTRTEANKPFPYIKHHYGQYSEELEDTKDQLLSMGLICAEPTKTKRGIRFGGTFYPSESGNIYRLSHPLEPIRDLFTRANPDLSRALGQAVELYGYLPEAKLIEIVYSLPEFQAKAANELIFSADLPDQVAVQLDEEECDELELSLNPKFLYGASLILTGLEKTDLDFTTLKTVTRAN